MPKMGSPAKAVKEADDDSVQPAETKTTTPIEPPTGDDFFTSLDDTEDFTKALFYGKEGSGKTTAAAKAANLGRTLIINAEGGLKKRALAIQGIDVSNVAVWPAPGDTITADSLGRLHRRILSDLQSNPGSWHTVVMDSITEIHHVIREQATDKRVAKSRTEVDPDFVDRDDYGVMTNQLRKLVRRFRDLPCHVVLIALEKDDEEIKQFRPSLTPALVTDVLGYVDIVGRFGSPDDTFRARFKGTDRIRAKDRFGILPASLAEPGFDRIQAWLDGTLTLENDPIQQGLEKADAEKAAEAEAAAKAEAEAKAAKKRAPRKAAAKKAAPAAEDNPSEDEKEDTPNEE